MSAVALVLALHAGRGGGIDVYVTELAHAFGRLGWQVRLVSCLLPGPDPLEGVPHVGLAPEDPAAVPAHERAWPRALASWLARQDAADFDLVVAAHPFTAPHTGPWARRHRLPHWTIYHGVDAWSLTDSLRREIAKGGTVIAVSRFTADAIEAQVRPAAGPVRLLPPLVDTDVFAPRPVPRPPRPTLLTVSRLWQGERFKGHARVLEALPWLMQRLGGPVDYRIVGEGDGVPDLEQRVHALGLQQRVRFEGFLETRALVEAYSASDVFVMPSRTERRRDGTWTGEGFGIVFIEAAACGCPSVGLAQGGAAEAIEHGVSGLLADSDDGVREALLRLLASPAEARALGRSAREWVTQRYSAPAFDARLGALLAGLRRPLLRRWW